MNPRLHGLPKLSKGGSGATGGWVARIASNVDLLTDILANIEVGPGLQLSVSPTGRIRIDGRQSNQFGDCDFAVSASVPDSSAQSVSIRVNGGTVFLPGGGYKTVDAVTLTRAQTVYVAVHYQAEVGDGGTASISTSTSIESGGAGDWICYLAKVVVSTRDNKTTARVRMMHIGDVIWQ